MDTEHDITDKQFKILTLICIIITILFLAFLYYNNKLGETIQNNSQPFTFPNNTFDHQTIINKNCTTVIYSSIQNSSESGNVKVSWCNPSALR